MARVLLEDDVRPIRSAHRWRWVGLVLSSFGVAFTAGPVVAAVASRTWGLAALSPIGLFFLWEGRNGLQRTAGLRSLELDEPSQVDIDGDGLTIRHPVLSSPLVVPWSLLRSFAVDLPPTQTRWRRPRYRLFPVRRRPGSLHPLDEPQWFLFTDTERLGKRQVPLLATGFGPELPNVALLLHERRSATLMAPPAADDRGWTPPLVIHPPAQSVNALTEPLVRSLRTLHPSGLYLRVASPAPLCDALRNAGVREGFTSDDWAHAVGNGEARASSGPPHHQQSL